MNFEMTQRPQVGFTQDSYCRAPLARKRPFAMLIGLVDSGADKSGGPLIGKVTLTERCDTARFVERNGRNR